MLRHSYDPALVFASMVVASLAGYASLDLSARVAAVRSRARVLWVTASAIAMGVGIWSMHFIAMLALDIGMQVFYDVPLLITSILIACGASAITFLGAAKSVTTARLGIASLAMGPAIAGMHYVGMASMRMPARIEYNELLVALSVIVAISASFAALTLSRRFSERAAGDWRWKVAASLVMGAAVYGMHYTGMSAAQFHPAPPSATPDSGVIATPGLAWAIAIGATVVIMMAVLAGIADRRLESANALALDATRQQALVVERLQAIGHKLVSELDLQKLVQAVTDAGTELTGAQFGAFFYNRVNEAGEDYMLYTIAGVPREAFSKFPMPRNTPVFAPTFYGEGVVRSDDITKDPRYGQVGPHHGMPKGHLPVRSYLAVPVASRTGTVLGGLFFGHEKTGVFSALDEQLVEGIAGWAAVAMDNARLFDGEQRARTEAERANRAKSDFLAVMSHELRTPLNAIIGYTDLLQMGISEDPERRARSLERIGLSARHLLQLIDEILTFSRLEAGQERVHLEEVCPTQLVTEVEALMEPIAARKALALTCHAPAIDRTIHTDPRMVRQILINLVTNAIKFTEKGSVDVSLEYAGDDALFRVRDTGAGIAPEHHERIFEAFWRTDHTSTRQTDGTGLGLSVSQRLAALLGGSLVVESEPGAGSTFILTLPPRAPA